MNSFPLLSMLSKFRGDFKSHLDDLSIPAVVKTGGSCLKKPQDIKNFLSSRNEISVLSAIGGCSRKILELSDLIQYKQSISPRARNEAINDKFLEIYHLYVEVFKGLGVKITPFFEEKKSLIEEVWYLTDLRDSKECRKLECFMLAELGEKLTVELVCEVAKLKGVKLEYVDTQQCIFLKDDFPPLPEDRFAPVSIDLERTLTQTGKALQEPGRKICAGFLAKNGLLGWNGSDTTASIIALAYYLQHKQIPRVVFFKEETFKTLEGVGVEVSAATKYEYLKTQQKRATQPFIHPQAIGLLVLLSIPFEVRARSNPDYVLRVTSCRKLAASSGCTPPVPVNEKKDTPFDFYGADTL